LPTVQWRRPRQERGSTQPDRRALWEDGGAVCLRWLIQQDVVVIPRTSKVERLSENLEIFDFNLTDDEMGEIFAMGTRGGRITDFGFAPKWD
jgi:diketogulonate reductase-like aldo/keto reductase